MKCLFVLRLAAEYRRIQMSNAKENSMPEEVIVSAFVNSGRTGRRNAMGDILEDGETCANTSDLPDQLDAMNIKAAQPNQQTQTCSGGEKASKS